MNSFTSRIYKIGINPYVLVPSPVLKELFKKAGKDKGPVPVKIMLNGHRFIQTLVKYSGRWRLYLNTPMRRAAGIDVGDNATVKIEFDPRRRTIVMHPSLRSALHQHGKAKSIFDKLSPSLQKEIIRYIGSLKTKVSVEKNIARAILFLEGRERFIGRDKPPIRKK